MLNVYYSNKLAQQKDILIQILKNDPNPNPFEPETILVQSVGMSQWLQLQIANELGIAGNVEFPYPTSFLWQQYRLLFPNLPKENIFEPRILVWRLMALIPKFIKTPAFLSLERYLQQQDQLKLYQLAIKIAALFDQYLVYRSHWLIHWEEGDLQSVFNEIKQRTSSRENYEEDIWGSIQWQSILWNALVDELKQETDEAVFSTSHRAYLQQRYFEKLDNLTSAEKNKLPKRIFIFGISSLPPSQLAVLEKLSEHCRIYLFFTMPTNTFWGDVIEDRVVEKLALKSHLPKLKNLDLLDYQGNPLLTTWGKQGKEFLNSLLEQDIQGYDFFYDEKKEQISLLNRVQHSIAELEHDFEFELLENDRSIQIHSCHSKMREVEVLHNRLLQIFEENPDLSPTDIVVMSPDIDSYAPYITAVFSQYKFDSKKNLPDPRFIPFSISDQKISNVNPIIESFLNLLAIKDRKFTAEEILDFLEIQAIREKFNFSEEDITLLRDWIVRVGIRAGLEKDHPEWENYNSWENGLNRLLLGVSLKSEHNAWQSILAFDESYGLGAELVGSLAKFIEDLTAWVQVLQNPQSIESWKEKLNHLLQSFYADDAENTESLLLLSQTVESITDQIKQTQFEEAIDIDVLYQVFEQALNDTRSHIQFLVGKVNFCTMLPMRAIPFKVVCLLGMNEGEFPRQQTLNSFDLMQYAPQKGDRAKRDDDRYLFLEALLSTEQILYISYIGQSLTGGDKKPPSILVSQLQDFIVQNLQNSDAFNICEHPMTVFSPKNFTGNNVSYDKEWIEAKYQNTDQKKSTFLSTLVRQEEDLPNEIEIRDLIAYLQSPVKFFFQYHLGVRFDDQETLIPESEHFELSHLDQYLLLDDLLNVNEDEVAQFFENEKLKGNLPACHFADLAKNKLVADITQLKHSLSHYIGQENQLLEIDFSLKIGENDIRLIGHIPNLFGNEIVQWRVGGLRDKDTIQAWVYYLLLCATGKQEIDFKFYFRKDDQAGCLSFNEVSQAEAIAQLQCYLTDYLASFSQLKWAVTEGFDYIKPNPKKNETSTEADCRSKLLDSNDIYIQRVLSQSSDINYADIHQRTQDWFELMLNKKGQ
ncbi:exodeoxyribonuclease V subunit gamma [Otariodibacter oris]|uniref:RecBCD enzyme subunit RecC n=1 Tax=Otariodibacter oris TaxID=1032623 RepID=A0A420XGD3_9PAST|nr:exodeoxyribonuclease V subunit gamma [Otariodibacter oris]QGM80055.1 exodeoxyribonuclease V subunit gamma [Otariodibacter oris]RKR71880.1 DNA helicase/exodeoxyribonuclease V gamma subunit [Otariodibacter oris]